MFYITKSSIIFELHDIYENNFKENWVNLEVGPEMVCIKIYGAVTRC